MSANDQMHL